MAGPWLVLITGHPASGKSTLADRLGKDLHFTVLHRDAFKETLFESLGIPSPQAVGAYGKASYALLHLAAAAMMATHSPLIIDANYSVHPGRDEVAALTHAYGYQTVEVVLSAPEAVLATRFQNRIKRGERHPGHRDDERLMELLERIRTPYVPLDLPGPHFPIDTSQPEREWYPNLVAAIRMLADDSQSRGE